MPIERRQYFLQELIKAKKSEGDKEDNTEAKPLSENAKMLIKSQSQQIMGQDMREMHRQQQINQQRYSQLKQQQPQQQTKTILLGSGQNKVNK